MTEIADQKLRNLEIIILRFGYDFLGFLSFFLEFDSGINVCFLFQDFSAFRAKDVFLFPQIFISLFAA